MPQSKEYRITPLGAAVVEAIPDRRKVRKIQRDFEQKKECPASAIFTAEEVEAFYREIGQEVTAVGDIA